MVSFYCTSNLFPLIGYQGGEGGASEEASPGEMGRSNAQVCRKAPRSWPACNRNNRCGVPQKHHFISLIPLLTSHKQTNRTADQGEGAVTSPLPLNLSPPFHSPNHYLAKASCLDPHRISFFQQMIETKALASCLSDQWWGEVLREGVCHGIKSFTNDCKWAKKKGKSEASWFVPLLQPFSFSESPIHSCWSVIILPQTVHCIPDCSRWAF